MKLGVIDVGGGLRGAYGAGVLDRCIDMGIKFDCCLGVSAGSANVVSYAAGQRGRNKPFYDDYAFRKEYMSVKNLVSKHSYLDLEYVYGTLSNSGGENPLDYDAFIKSDAEVYIVAADARTGEAKYFTKSDLKRDDYSPLMASCCIPVIDRPCVIDDVPYYDGGLADPVPLKKALELGCDKVCLILTKPLGAERVGGRDAHFAHVLRRRYPAAAAGLEQRAVRYNEAVKLAQQLEAEGRVCIIAPDSTEGMATLTKDKASIDRMYQKGYDDAGKIKSVNL